MTYSVPSVIGYTAPPVLDPGTNAHHDESNANVAGFCESDGFVGIFTDINDDGDYDQAAGESLTDDIQTVGAYPMFYDMHVETDENGDVIGVNTDGGCLPGFGSTRLPAQMAEAGYGPHTGVFQIVYLEEPTVLYDTSQRNILNYTTGGNAYVFGSQAILAYMNQTTPDSKISIAIQAALDELPVNQDGNPATDVVLGGENVIFPGLEVDNQSDFDDQCRADTGDFNLNWNYFHACAEPLIDCSGDTIVTSYVFELTDGTVGSVDIPAFTEVGSDTKYNFHHEAAGHDSTTGLNQWIDVDPFDGDSSRNLEEDNSPPEPEE